MATAGQAGVVSSAASAAVAAMVGGPSTWEGIEAFVEELWGPWLRRTQGLLWTAGFASSAAGESWHGNAGVGWLRSRFSGLEADLYVCIGVLQAGSRRRSLGGVVAQPVLIVDDVGTKVDEGAWERLFALGCPRPTAQVRTSVGNETWFWLLDGDATSEEHARDVRLARAWLIEQRLTDEVMDATRYVRLPGGWNSKPKHQGPGGPGDHPRVCLTAWRPGPVSFDAIGRTVVGHADGAMDGVEGGPDAWRQANAPQGNAARAMLTGAQLAGGAGGAGVGALVRSADLGRPDALMRLWQEMGGGLTQRGAGVVEALCPNIGQHTTRADTGFAFLGGGLMHCNHASCQGLSTVDFRSMMMQAYDERQEARRVLGQLGQGEAATAVEYLARETVRDLGGLTDTADVVATAQVMAASSAARRAAAAAALSAGVDGLVERFVWVGSLAVFFDTLDRVVVPEAQFDTQPCVIDVIPVGKTGKDRARNVVLNHPNLRVADGLARVAGDLAAVVDVRDDRGQVRRVANTWTPSVWAGRRVKRRPVEWLELLAYVIPEPDKREWLIKWLAWLIQRPGVRLMTVPLIVGGQGIGKDAILTPIKILLGRHNIQSLSMNQIGAAFNQWMLADLVILPELKLSSDGKMYNQIKDWTANPEEWVQINEKYQRPYTTRVTFSMISMTNHLDALPGLEADDRRWQIYVSGAKPADRAFYNRVIDGAKTDAALAGLLDFLLDVDLTGFGPFTEMPGGAADKQAMLADTLRGAAQWTFQSLQEGGRFEGRSLVTIAEVEDAALSDQNSRVSRGTDTRPVRDGLRAAGWHPHGQAGAGQNRLSLWVSPALKNSPIYPLMGPAGLRDAYLREKEEFQRIYSARLFDGK